MRRFFYIILLLTFNLGFLTSQESGYSVEFSQVLINGKKIDFNEKTVILSEQDSITISYLCKNNKNEQTPFLFRTELLSGEQSAVKSISEPIIQYKKLPEGNYSFKLSAFDLKKNWTTKEIQLVFRVDNFEARLIKDINGLNTIINEQNKKIEEFKKKGDKSAIATGINWLSIIGGFLVASLIFALLYVFVKPKTKDDLNDESKRRFHRLELENNNLKAELSALRSQLDGLQRRTEDMRMRNRELEESVNKLMDSKSELEQLQAQKDELFAMLIHDIKNPAGIIKSLVELLRSYDLSATDQQSIIDDILSTTKVIVQLSQEVSRVLALEGGKLNMDFRVANLNGICKNVYNRFKVKSNEKSISFLYDVPDGLPDIKLDDGKIDEVLSNLVSNAIKFTQKGGSIRLKAQQIDATVVIEVSDNGLGLSEEDLNSAFKRGAQLSAKPTGGESSTGLGLWIVKKLVEAHNGRVWVRSSLGKGSTFAFSLPLEQKDATKVVMMN